MRGWFSLLGGMLCAVAASADPLLSANYSKSFVGGSFGPFYTDQEVVIMCHTGLEYRKASDG